MNLHAESSTHDDACDCEGCDPYGEKDNPVVDLRDVGRGEPLFDTCDPRTCTYDHPASTPARRPGRPSQAQLRRLENHLIATQTSLRADCDQLRELARRSDSRDLTVAAIAVYDAIFGLHFARTHVTDARAAVGR